MSTYFPTVPVEVALRKSHSQIHERPRPLILIVDDEPIIAETLAAILDGSGLSAMTAPNARKALEIAALMPPEMLITDFAMPGMNGLDLAIEVNRSIPDCEIILFSGQIVDLGDSPSASGCDFVTMLKPVHPADLLARVYERLARRGITVIPPLASKEYDGSLPAHSHGLYTRSGHVTMRQRLRHGNNIV
jgi:CheY-like chemotaxis protein